MSVDTMKERNIRLKKMFLFKEDENEQESYSETKSELKFHGKKILKKKLFCCQFDGN